MNRKLGFSLAILLTAAMAGICVFRANAAALSGGVVTEYRDAPSTSVVPMASNVVYRGGLVCVNDAGKAVAAANTSGLRCIGVAESTADNTSGAAPRVVVRRGLQLLATSSTNAVTAASVGHVAYVADDGHVCVQSGTNYLVAVGTIAEVSDDLAAVWVDVGNVWACAQADL